MACCTCEHHKSKITVWANVLIVVSFILTLVAGNTIYGILAGLVGMIIVNFTGCKAVKKGWLIAAAVLSIICSIGSFVFAATTAKICNDPENGQPYCFKHSRAMAIVAGILWIFSAVAAVKIPQIEADGSGSSPPTFETTSVRNHEQA